MPIGFKCNECDALMAEPIFLSFSGYVNGLNVNDQPVLSFWIAGRNTIRKMIY